RRTSLFSSSPVPELDETGRPVVAGGKCVAIGTERDGRDVVRVCERGAGRPPSGRLPDPGGSVEAGRGEVTAVRSKRDLPNDARMANAWHPGCPGGTIHESNAVDVIGRRRPMGHPKRPEDRICPGRVEPGGVNVVRAFRFPGEFGGLKGGPAIGPGET